MSDDEEVRYTCRMPKRLREDAKRNADHGDLAEETRDLFRRVAYGSKATEGNSQLQKLQAELEDVRDHVDDLRRERRKIDAEIESQESRATRLEERISNLEERADKFESTVDALENVLLNGGRIYPERIDDDLDASRVIQELQERNPDVPDYAFELSQPHQPTDWREVDNS